MRRSTLRVRFILIAVLALPAAFLGTDLTAQEIEQPFRLQPGWNSIYLEVTPQDRAIERVFAGIPVEAVLRSNEKNSSVDYLRDPNGEKSDAGNWLRFQPDSKDANTLFSVDIHTAYLVKVAGDEAVDLRVRGKPSLRPVAWRPHAWNLRGFPIDPDHPPTFEAFFAATAAHSPQKIRVLSKDGKWADLSEPKQRMRWGEAYLVHCEGPSTFSAPLEVRPSAGDTLTFDATRSQASLKFTSLFRQRAGIVLADRAGMDSLLLVRRPDDDRGIRFEAIGEEATTALNEQGEGSEAISLQRSGMTSAQYGTIIEVRDYRGTRRLVPVEARSVNAALQGQTEPGSFAGLWIGHITVNAVQEVQAGVFDAGTTLLGGDGESPAAGQVRFVDSKTETVSQINFRAKSNRADRNLLRIRIREAPGLTGQSATAKFDPDKRQVLIGVRRGQTTIRSIVDAFNSAAVISDRYLASPGSPVQLDAVIQDELSPVSRPLQMRVLIHVDGTGQARLLKEAFQMWRDGGEITDRTTGLTRVDPRDPGGFVLVTNRRRLSRYTGATLRNGKPIGRRLSSVGFDFAGSEVAASAGNLQPGKTLKFSIELKALHPTNPFFHKNHPDHSKNDIQVVRSIGLSVLPTAPHGTSEAEYGYTVLAAHWQETLKGLHRAPLTVTGSVALRRLTFNEDLNN